MLLRCGILATACDRCGSNCDIAACLRDFRFARDNNQRADVRRSGVGANRVVLCRARALKSLSLAPHRHFPRSLRNDIVEVLRSDTNYR
jgi:hypothetical protein